VLSLHEPRLGPPRNAAPAGPHAGRVGVHADRRLFSLNQSVSMTKARISLSLTLLAVASAMLLILPTGMALAMGDADYTVTFQGDASFNKPHGGQEIHAALVDAGTGKVVAKMEATVSKTDAPAFSIVFTKDLKAGEKYEMAYWIDSNFGGGTKGVCDEKQHDHQWKVELGTASGDLTHTEKHQPSMTQPVCDLFKSM
jgi:hypothetical protein